MIANTCQHFHFGGATASLKNWHLRIQHCKHLSTLPFWGRYGKPEKLTFNDPWLQAVVNTSLFPTKQNFERCMAKPLVKLQFFKKHVGVNPCGNCILVEKFFSRNPFKQKLSRTFFCTILILLIFTTIMASSNLVFLLIVPLVASSNLAFLPIVPLVASSNLVFLLIVPLVGLSNLLFLLVPLVASSNLVFLLIVPLVASSNWCFCLLCR